MSEAKHSEPPKSDSEGGSAKEPLAKSPSKEENGDGRPHYDDRDPPAACSCFANICTCCAESGDEPLGFIPDDKRKMTDMCCCIAFIMFWVGMVGVASTGFALGNPRRLFYGTDYEGNTCSVSDGFENKPVIVYPRINEDYVFNVRLALQGDSNAFRFYGVCANRCPSALDVVCNYEISDAEKPAAEACVKSAAYGSSQSPTGRRLRFEAMGASPEAAAEFEEGLQAEFGGLEDGNGVFGYGDGEEEEEEEDEEPEMAPGPWLDDEGVHHIAVQSLARRGRRLDVSCKKARANCWLIPTESTPVLNRCVPSYNVSEGGSRTCVLPEDVSNAFDPRCVLMRDQRAADIFRPPSPSLVVEQLQNAQSTWSRNFGDLQRAWWVIFLCAVVFGCLFGFAFVKLTQMFVGIVVWTIVVLAVLTSILFTFFCYFRAGILSAQDVQSSTESLVNRDFDGVSQYTESLDSTSYYQTAFKVGAYTMTVVSILLIGIIIAVRQQIKNAIAIIKLGAMSMFQMPLLIFLPFAGAALMLAFLAWWAYAAAALASAGEITPTDMAKAFDSSTVYEYFPGANVTAVLEELRRGNSTVATYETVDTLKYLLLYHFFGLLWTNQFILGIGITTIGGAVGAYYFSLDGRESSPVYGERLKRWKIRENWRTTGAALEMNPATEHEHEEGKKSGGAMSLFGIFGQHQSHHSSHADDKAAHDPAKELKDEKSLANVPYYLMPDGTVGSPDNPAAEELPDFTLYHKHGPWGNYEIAASLWRAVRYHLGTISFGSFLIAFVQLVRFIFQYMSARLEKLEHRNAMAHYIKCCITSCLYVLEQLVRFVSSNALYFTAIKGYSFCRSARNVFLLLFRYTALLAIVNAVTEVIMFLGKISVTLLCGYLAYLFLDNLAEFQPGGKRELTGQWVPVLVTMLFAYGVSSAFFTVWEVAIDTVLVCFTLDMDESLMYPRNKGKMGRYGIPLHYRSPDMRGGCPSCCYRSPPFSWCCFDLSSCCCGLFACCAGCCGAVREHSKKTDDHHRDPILEARTAAYVAPAAAAAAAAGGGVAAKKAAYANGQSGSGMAAAATAGAAAGALAAGGAAGASAGTPAAAPGAGGAAAGATGAGILMGGAGAAFVSKFDQQYVHQPSLDCLHKVYRMTSSFPHEYHALQELERRDDLDSWEKTNLKSIRHEIASMMNRDRDRLNDLSKRPTVTRKAYLARHVMLQRGMQLSERAELNLELDHQEEGKWLMVVEQARVQIEREEGKTLFGTTRAGPRPAQKASSSGVATPGFGTANPVAGQAREVRVGQMTMPPGTGR